MEAKGLAGGVTFLDFYIFFYFWPRGEYFCKESQISHLSVGV